MQKYSVKQLAKLAGVSVRTLHVYDKMGLLKPLFRTEAKYRLYGEQELLRLQQILFYKELDFQLQEIAQILDDKDFDVMDSLKNHKLNLRAKQDRLATLIVTIDKTIENLKKDTVMSNPAELYEGLSVEKAQSYRIEAIEKYGEEVHKSEQALLKLTKPQIAELKTEQVEIAQKLFALMHKNIESEQVQTQIAQHYENIRKFWGTHGSVDSQADAYAGLGQLYVDDERFTMIDGKSQHEYALFLSKAMKYFADNRLK